MKQVLRSLARLVSHMEALVLTIKKNTEMVKENATLLKGHDELILKLLQEHDKRLQQLLKRVDGQFQVADGNRAKKRKLKGLAIDKPAKSRANRR